ncbi:MAG: hypothetical protein JKY94_12035 [Rhodobacteraceae bacterium]|nr:hypothetical protein [Paracoccaceae bacterium]
MFGVVLWSDAEENKAVIWCEDHGDLAFYHQPARAVEVALDAGDWVRFDMTTDRHLRFAHNPRLVSEGVYPDIADVLNKAPPLGGHSEQTIHSRGSAEIIPFTRIHSQHVADPGSRSTANHV